MSNAVKLLHEQKLLIPSNSPVPNRKILIVDDEPEIAKGIERILSPQDSNVRSIQSSRQKTSPKLAEKKANEFEIVVVHSPEDALAAIDKSLKEDRPFAMGFFDVMLGAKIDGIELVKQAMQKDSHLFAVFVTAYHDRNVDAIGHFLGEDCRERWDYINKPFTEGEILQKARNATSLWDLNRLKEWQSERLSEAHQLLLSTEKQNAIAAIGRSVAHEFGNLLTHIIGHAEIAKFSNDVEDIKNSLDIILKAGNTAANVLKNFRNLNESNDRQPEFNIVNLMRVLDEALELMEFRFRRHGIRVHKQGLEEMSCEAIKSSLVQVFANVFINAIHAMPQGGDLFIHLDSKADSCEIQIRDTGGGIPEEHLDRVTEPLFTTKGSEGTGLGLAICREIVEVEHRGRFKIKNHKEGGVVVSLTLPKIQER